MIYRKVNTNLSETLDEIGLQKAKRDDYAKCILADPQVLARIVKNVVTEFEQMSVEEIIPCIGEPTVTLSVPELLSVKNLSIGTEDIEEEQKLMLSVGMAVASGDANAVAIASANLVAFKNRHIEKLQNDNKALAGEILSWSDRKKLNAGVRQLAAVTGIPFGNMWNELYKNLQYKYGICLKQRGGKPFIQWVDESEWENVIKTFCAMCEAYDQSPTEMFQQTTPTIKA